MLGVKNLRRPKFMVWGLNNIRGRENTLVFKEKKEAEEMEQNVVLWHCFLCGFMNKCS